VAGGKGLPAYLRGPAHGAVIEEQLKKPLANEILFGALKDGGVAAVERKGEGLEIVAKGR
jgi:ATP-dependent Clp protease ATP-binding subunit ClpA